MTRLGGKATIEQMSSSTADADRALPEASASIGCVGTKRAGSDLATWLHLSRLNKGTKVTE